MLTEDEKILLDIAYLDRGLIPTGSTLHGHGNNHHRLVEALQEMSPDDAQKLKRRYRKHFRRAVVWQEKRIAKRYDGNKLAVSRAKLRYQAKCVIGNFRASLGLDQAYVHELKKPHPGAMFRRQLLVRDYLFHLIRKHGD